MAKTYEAITSTTLGSDTATVTINNIPSDFTDLRLVISAYSTRTASGVEAFYLRLNNTTSTYSWVRMLGSGSVTESGRANSDTGISGVRPNTNMGGNTTPSIAIFDIFSYANSGVFKTILGSHACNSSNSHPVGRTIGLWQSTSAVTRIDVSMVLGPNIKSGSTFSLYGIKAA